MYAYALVYPVVANLIPGVCLSVSEINEVVSQSIHILPSVMMLRTRESSHPFRQHIELELT